MVIHVPFSYFVHIFVRLLPFGSIVCQSVQSPALRHFTKQTEKENSLQISHEASFISLQEAK